VVDAMLAEYWANADSLLLCSSLASKKSRAPAAKAPLHATTRNEIRHDVSVHGDAFSFEALRVTGYACSRVTRQIGPASLHTHGSGGFRCGGWCARYPVTV
jgi:hypothetical protein